MTNNFKNPVYIEVTNTLSLPTVSGIQRVTREILRNVLEVESEFDFIPIVYCQYCQAWRTLTRIEFNALFSTESSNPKLEVTPFVKVISLFKSLISSLGLRNVFKQIIRFFYIMFYCECDSTSLIKELRSGAILLDVESCWFSSVDRAILLPELKRKSINTAVVQYDLIPILRPDLFPSTTNKKFSQCLRAHAENGSLFICISKSTERDLEEYLQREFFEQEHGMERITLGADLPFPYVINKRNEDGVSLPEGRYILSVGTMEPRKNYAFLLSAFEGVADSIPDVSLVIVGKEGWHSSGLIRKIRSHRLYGNRLFWLQNIDDYTLSLLYRRAYLGVVPSLYEGYGLPVAEFLLHGCVTLCSNVGSLPEVGGDYVVYFDLNNRNELMVMLTEYLLDQKKYDEQKIKITYYTPPTWKQTGEQVVSILEKHFHPYRLLV